MVEGDVKPEGLRDILHSLDRTTAITISSGVFGGYMNCHGHFLVELLPRLWPMLELDLETNIGVLLDGNEAFEHLLMFTIP